MDISGDNLILKKFRDDRISYKQTIVSENRSINLIIQQIYYKILELHNAK